MPSKAMAPAMVLEAQIMLCSWNLLQHDLPKADTVQWRWKLKAASPTSCMSMLVGLSHA